MPGNRRSPALRAGPASGPQFCDGTADPASVSGRAAEAVARAVSRPRTATGTTNG